MNEEQFRRLLVELVKISDSLEAVIKRLESVEGQLESCNENLIVVSKNTW